MHLFLTVLSVFKLLIILPLVYKCSLEQLLSDMEADVFITIPEKYMHILLRDQLGESPDLLDSIIHSVMQVSNTYWSNLLSTVTFSLGTGT